MSFKLFAVGNLPAAPELGTKGECRFSLISNDYAGPNKPKNITQVWFVAFGATAEALAKHCHTGDQLIVTAQVVANNPEGRGDDLPLQPRGRLLRVRCAGSGKADADAERDSLSAAPRAAR